MGSPALVDAMSKASTSGKDRAITQGVGAMRQGAKVENGVVTFTKGPKGVPTYPNLAYWDAVKRELDDAARAGAAKFFGAGDAIEAGQNFVGASNKFGLPAARKQLAKMSAEEKQLFQDGYVSRLVETIEKTGDRRTDPQQDQRVAGRARRDECCAGARARGEVEARLRVEGIMDLARPAVQGNSTTARQLVELGLAGGVGGYEGYQGDPQAIDEGRARLWRGARPSP
jgi:hypothetical protein